MKHVHYIDENTRIVYKRGFVIGCYHSLERRKKILFFSLWFDRGVMVCQEEVQIMNLSLKGIIETLLKKERYCYPTFNGYENMDKR